MELGGGKLLVCNCEGTMSLDGKALGRACGGDGALFANTQLCRAQIENLRTDAAEGGPLLVACTQEQPVFDETLREAGLDIPVAYANIRERAGWSEAGADALPKMAALLAEAALDIPPAPSVTPQSPSVCLLYCRGQDPPRPAHPPSGLPPRTP